MFTFGWPFFLIDFAFSIPSKPILKVLIITDTAKNTVITPISWHGNFVERHSFRIVSGESPETMRKLCLSTKFLCLEIR